MKALVLAGGLGTRLRGVVDSVPKPMAEVAGRPFLEHLVAQLVSQGVRDIVLSTGYRGEVVEAHFGDGARFGARIAYSRESEPLGTGGAVKLAAPLLGADPFVVMNGDSFADVDIRVLARAHEARGAVATLALVEVPEVGRYGAVEVDRDGTILAFVEKGGASRSRLVNAGVYVLGEDLLSRIPPGRKVSLEQEIFPTLVGGPFLGIAAGGGFFIDIGVPEDYRRLCAEPGPMLDAVARS